MSASDEGQERTEQPTAKKLEDARRQGQVPRSRELSTMLVTLASATVLYALGSELAQGFMRLLRYGLSPSHLNTQDPARLPGLFHGFLVEALWLTWPVLAVCFFAALVAAVMLGGMTFSLSFKLEKLNPITGIGRLFSLQSAVELGKSVLKVLFIGGIAWVLLSGLSDDILGLSLQSPEAALRGSGSMLSWFFLVVSLPLVLIAAIDVPWQLWNHHKQLRMTRQEVMDEHKESEGRPEVKSRIREMQQAAARRRMMEKVPKADVIITNPTHYAVALRYDEARGGAPVVVAKGIDEVAARIRAVGGEHQVPLVASPRLARAIYASCQLDQEIPAGLYLAVAQILTYVYQLKQWEAMGGAFPLAPEPVVDEQFLKGHGMTPGENQDESR
ncbi:MAG: flagellar biosynthesis protein FlhB [Perlucidibaca sp.]